MLKIVNLISLFTIVIGGLGIYSTKNNIFIYYQQKTKLNDPLVKKNAAHTERYGDPTKLSYRFDIFMTGDMYAYFLATIKDQDIEDFAQLLVNKKPYLHDEWDLAQQQISRESRIFGSIYHKNPDYFKNDLIQWIESSTYAPIFKQIFTGENMKYNTFKIPSASVKEIQRDWRKEGVILQFNYLCLNPSSENKEWSVHDARIFPYTANVTSVLKYYQNVVNSSTGALERITPPKFSIPRVPSKQRQNLSNPVLMKYFVQRLVINLNCQDVWDKKLISIPISQEFITISRNIESPTRISISFLKDNFLRALYITKPVDVYMR